MDRCGGRPSWIRSEDTMNHHPSANTMGWVLARAARLHRYRLNEKLADIGLFAGQEKVLEALSSGTALTTSELAAILLVRNPTASKAVTRLIATGFVERRTDPEDA